MLARARMGDNRIPRSGDGTFKHPGPPAAIVAERLAKMHIACRATREERKAEQRRWLESLSGMSLEELRRSTPNRLWSVAMLHLGGYDLSAIARGLGYTHTQSAVKALKHPAVQRIVELIREEQVARVLRGEYGVQA